MDRSLVTKATSADEVPTPGYMFNEIARISHASVKDCQQLEEFLLKRLKKDNIYVKQKTLRVIKHCCQQGHPTFRREMQRHTSEIKECLAYRGTADPLHGDALNKAVRDTAQEVMTALFDSSTPSETLHSTGRMQGFGSDGIGSGPPSSFSGGSYASPGVAPSPPAAGFAPPKIESGAYSSGKMQGFGNPSFSQKPAEASKMAAMATSVASGLKDGITRMSQRTKGPSEDGYASHGSYSGGGAGNLGGGRGFGGASSFQAPPQVSAPAPPPASTPHQAGRPGGGWDQSTVSQPLAPPSQASLPATNAQSSASMVPKLAQAPAGAFEERLVNEITAPGGVRASVPREELRKFSTACKSLDSSVISQLLQSKLDGGEWQCRLKALSAIEALVKEGNEQVLLFFQEQPENIQAQLSSTQASLKEKAGKVLHLIGLGGDVAAPAVKPSPKRHPMPAAAAHPPPAAPEENLLDLEEAPPAASTEVSALPSAAAAAEHADAAISGAEPASNGGGSIFDNLQLAAEPPAAPAPSAAEVTSGADMFSGLLLSDGKEEKEPAAAAKGSNGVEALAHDSAASSCSMSSLEMMMASTPAATPSPSAPSGISSGSTAGIGGMQSPPIGSFSGNAYNAQQQMAMMQQQMAMMQQQIMQQQQMLRYGGKPPAIQPPGMQYGSPMGVPMQMQMPGASQSPLQLGTGEQGQGGFDFMGKPGGSDAFDFVGDVMSKNKKAI